MALFLTRIQSMPRKHIQKNFDSDRTLLDKEKAKSLSSSRKRAPLCKQSLPFASLWNANSFIGEYTALKDNHASSYFGTEPAKTRIKKLNQALRNLNWKQSIDAIKAINSQRKNMKKLIKKHHSIQNVKILPYCAGLRTSSKLNLSKFKQTLGASQINKEREHNQYIKEYWVNKKPDEPEIKLVRTLCPLERYKIQRAGQFFLTTRVSKRKN